MEQIWVQSLSGTVSAFYQRTSGGLLFNAYADGEERKVSGGFIWRIQQESTLDPTKMRDDEDSGMYDIVMNKGEVAKATVFGNGGSKAEAVRVTGNTK